MHPTSPRRGGVALLDRPAGKEASRRLHPDALGRLVERAAAGDERAWRGLVDELGGLQHALALAKEHAGIDRDAEVELVIYPPRRTLLEQLANPFGTVDGNAALSAWLGLDDHRGLQTITAPLRVFRRGEPLAIMPNVFVR